MIIILSELCFFSCKLDGKEHFLAKNKLGPNSTGFKKNASYSSPHNNRTLRQKPKKIMFCSTRIRDSVNRSGHRTFYSHEPLTGSHRKPSESDFYRTRSVFKRGSKLKKGVFESCRKATTTRTTTATT